MDAIRISEYYRYYISIMMTIECWPVPIEKKTSSPVSIKCIDNPRKIPYNTHKHMQFDQNKSDHPHVSPSLRVVARIRHCFQVEHFMDLAKTTLNRHNLENIDYLSMDIERKWMYV